MSHKNYNSATSPVFSDSHWPPVRHRISFKIATVTFRVLQFQQPSYLSSFIPRFRFRGVQSQFFWAELRGGYSPNNPVVTCLKLQSGSSSNVLVKDFLDCLFPSSPGWVMSRWTKAAFLHHKIRLWSIDHPRIPKPGLDTMDRVDVSNYRPISNLTFISKVMEKIVAKQLIAYLASNNLIMLHASIRFPQGHSTETAILRVLSDIYSSIVLTKARLPSSLSVGCECSLWCGWSRYPSGTTIQIIRNNWVGIPLDQILPHIANADCTRGHIYINRGARPLGRPTGLRPRTSPICSLHSRCCRDHDVLWPMRSSLCGWYTAPRQLYCFRCGSTIAIGPPFHRGSSPVDDVKQALTESGKIVEILFPLFCLFDTFQCIILILKLQFFNIYNICIQYTYIKVYMYMRQVMRKGTKS